MAWLERSRLNVFRGMADHAADPRMQSAMARWLLNAEPAMQNADRLLAESSISTFEGSRKTGHRRLIHH